MDLKLRMLERSGNHEAWLRAAMRAGITYNYDQKLGPRSLLEEKCLLCDDHLVYSNCPHCYVHHSKHCDFKGPSQDAALVHDRVKIVAGHNTSCNWEAHEPKIPLELGTKTLASWFKAGHNEN